MTHEIVLVSPVDDLVAPVRLGCARLGFALWSPLQAGLSLEAVAARAHEHRPAALLLDLEEHADADDGSDWRALASSFKRAAATRRIPVLGLADHPAEVRAEARRIGCDDVIDRGAIERDLEPALRQWVRSVDQQALTEACRQPLHPAALKGIELFNHGDYFEAHEFLEEAWNDDPGPGRELYRGLLQIAVAYLQIERGNHAGATKLFLRMWNWLDPLPGRCRGVDVDEARDNARAVQQALAALAPDQIVSLDRSLLRPFRVDPDVG